jgi:hypothetical protein
MQHMQIQNLPQDIRELILVAVRTLIEKGPQGLVDAGLCGLCAPSEVDTMAEYLGDYPGNLVDLPNSAELWVFITSDGIWDIDLPLHNDREGRMDLFMFLRVDPKEHTVTVTDLYAP